MPSMANIIIQNAFAANVTYTAVTPSAGDRVAAVWRQNAASEVMGLRPTLTVLTRDNARKNGRVLDIGYKMPIFYTDTTTGQKVLLATVPLSVFGTLPTNVDTALINDAFVQFGNLLVSTLIRSVALEQAAPT